MSQNSKREVLLKMRERYVGRGREGRSKLIQEVCELCGYDRKHAIKLLNGKLPIAGGCQRRGGPRRCYGEPETAVLKSIWLAAEQPCGKRLKAALELWLPYYESEHGGIDEELRGRILRLAFTRSRPYRKNDNARVEQKNWTHVRQLVGYEDSEPGLALHGLMVGILAAWIMTSLRWMARVELNPM